MKKYFCLVVCCVFFLVLSTAVFAFGIQPASTQAFFVPEAKATYTFDIINSEDEDLVFTLSARDDMKELVRFRKTEVAVRAGESVPVEFMILFPKKMRPGLYEGNIVVGTQVVADRQAGGLVVDEALVGQIESGGFSAQLQLLHNVVLEVPVEGKYIVANLRVQDGLESVGVVTDIQNKGYEKIDALTSQVSIRENDVVLDLLPANSSALGLQESVSFQNTFQKMALDFGEYTVLAEIKYDNARLELSKKLQIGQPSLVVQVSDEYLAGGKIGKWDVEVKSLWNEPLNDQAFDMSILKGGSKVDQFRTFSFSIDPGMTKTVRSHIDASKLEFGEYVVEMVSQGVLLVNGTRVLHVIPEDEMPGEGMSFTLVMLVVIVLVLVCLIVVLLVWLQRKKEVVV